MGLIPAVACSELEPPEDCDLLFTIGDALLATASAALDPFMTDDDCDPPFQTYVSMERPAVVPGCDLLAVWLTRVGPGRANIAECASGIWPDLIAEWQVELWEHCYPSIDDLGRVPTPDELHRVNAHLYAHGAAIYNTTLASWLDKQGVYPSGVANMTFGPLVPILPNAKVTGWKFTVSVTVA